MVKKNLAIASLRYTEKRRILLTMRVEKRSRATVALAAAVLLLGVVAISVLLITPRSNQDVTSQSLQAQPTAPPANEINRTSPPVITTDAQPADAPVGSVDPSGLLSIAGSVLNPQGERLADIEIIAAPRRVFINEEDKQAAEQRTTSDVAGHFRFDGLLAGDYRIRTGETSLYPSASVSARAGSETVDLVLAPRQDLWIYGVVKDSDGEPLANVHIVPNRDPLNASYSDTAGNFSLFQTVHGSAQSQDSLQFSLDGYHDKRVVLRANDPYANQLPVADVRLERIEGRADVRGSVSADYAPVPRARVFLRSTDRNDHYDTSTDAGGYFALSNVVIGNYEIMVVPRGTYQDYTQSGLKVATSGLELSIALEPLQSGRLRGQMVDVQGRPVPNFSLWLTSLSARGRGSRPLNGDQEGYFELEPIPTGELRLATQSAPRIRLTGVTVSGDDDAPILLTLDVGDHVLEGSVVDRYSNAVPGARVSLIWSHQDHGVTSHAVRNTTSDASGYVRFSQLGPGVHALNVSAPGFQRRRIEHEVGVGDEMRIELQALTTARSQ